MIVKSRNLAGQFPVPALGQTCTAASSVRCGRDRSKELGAGETGPAQQPPVQHAAS